MMNSFADELIKLSQGLTGLASLKKSFNNTPIMGGMGMPVKTPVKPGNVGGANITINKPLQG